MGVTIKSKNFSADMGYIGFDRFREKVAKLSNNEFGKHYSDLKPLMFIFDKKDSKSYFDNYNAETDKLVKENKISVGIANFCYQADCEGSIDQDQAKQVYEKIKDYNDNVCYGYSGRSDCAMFSDLKNIFKDCAENGGTIDWN